MKKIGIFLCAVVLTFFVIGRGYAQVSLDLGSTFNSFADSRIKGQGSSFGFLFDLSGDMTAGYIMESANINLTSDRAAAPGTAPGTMDISVIRLLRNLVSTAGLNAGVGLGVGTVSIVAPAAAPLAANVITNTSAIEILTNLNYLPKEVGKVSGRISLTVGYRIIDIADVANPFGAVSKTLSDLNSIILGLGVALKF